MPSQYQRYLPYNFKLHLKGGWVSPQRRNYNNKLVDFNTPTLKGLVKNLKGGSDKELITKALQQGWFNWRLLSYGHLVPNVEVKDNGNWKFLHLKFGVSFFYGSNAYLRLVVLFSVLRYFYNKYKKPYVIFYFYNDKDYDFKSSKLKTLKLVDQIFNKKDKKFGLSYKMASCKNLQSAYGQVKNFARFARSLRSFSQESF